MDVPPGRQEGSLLSAHPYKQTDAADHEAQLLSYILHAPGEYGKSPEHTPMPFLCTVHCSYADWYQ